MIAGAASPSAAAAAGHLTGLEPHTERDARLQAVALAAVAAGQRADRPAARGAAGAAELCRLAARVADAVGEERAAALVAPAGR